MLLIKKVLSIFSTVARYLEVLKDIFSLNGIDTKKYLR